MSIRVFTGQIADAWIGCIERGHSIRSAAQFVGISPSSAMDYVAEGEADIAAGRTSEAASVAERYARARATRRDGWLGVVHGVAHAGEKDSDRRGAATWLLEHCEPEEFGAKAQIELTGKDGGPVQVAAADYSKLTDDELQTALALARKASGGDS